MAGSEDISSSHAWSECNMGNSEVKRREGKPKGKRREENSIDFRRLIYRQLPRYIVFG
jgi:hypothetical protein